ncbi:hypothetical protein EU527_01260 [Candidatus Thorarchaeota archaeon]|nr:MAG: hypothetical protein EU527_01260 [Candidatus Thorarchaeota archaeon]
MDENKDSTEMAEDLVDAIDEDAEGNEVDDGLTKRERSIEVSRVHEREKKAEELRKQLRKRKLGLLNYRWSAGILIIGGIIAIITNFTQVMTMTEAVPSEVGFNNFIEAFSRTGGAVYLFPAVAGITMIIIGYFAYTTPRYTWFSIFPAMLLAWSGATVYFLITFAVTIQEELTGEIYATFAPLLMFIIAMFNIIAIVAREYE